MILVLAKHAAGGKTPPVDGNFSFSFRMVAADSKRETQVAPYPGLVPVTLVINFLDGGVVCLSLGSLNFSDAGHPCPWKVIENLVFSIVSSLGPSCEKNPNEKIFGWFNNNLRPRSNLVRIPKTAPINRTTTMCRSDLGRKSEQINCCAVDGLRRLRAR